MKAQRFASGALALGGAMLMALGLYFAFLRPQLLPEDLSYMEASLTQVQTAMPGLGPWLAHVFGVLGGYMFATGLLTIYVAKTGLSTRRTGATVVVALSGLTSIGWMAITNFVIGSDFKWLLLLLTLPWVVALALFWVGKRKIPQ
jgi:hypothetical protein